MLMFDFIFLFTKVLRKLLELLYNVSIVRASFINTTKIIFGHFLIDSIIISGLGPHNTEILILFIHN